MTARDDLDLLRDHASGALSGAARAELEARLRAEPELAETARRWAEVAAWPDLPPPAPSRVTFDALGLDARGPSPRARRVLVGAALGLAAVVCVALGVRARLARDETPSTPAPDERVVVLTAIPRVGRVPRTPLETDVTPSEPVAEPAVPLPAPLPLVAESYRPVAGGALAFVDSWPTGRDLASLAARPAVVFVQVPGCPICAGMERGPFRDPEVLAAAEPFVLVRVDASKPLPAELALTDGDFSRWPVFVVVDRAGARAGVFGGDLSASVLARALRAAATNADAGAGSATAADWERAHAVARAVRRADAAATAAERVAALAEAERLAAAEPSLREVVAARRALVADEAAVALGAARDAAREGVAAAQDLLDRALVRFAGTPYEADLRRVRDRLVADRAFPLVRPPPEPSR